MRNKLLIIFVSLSFITHTISEQGGNIILSRLTLADVFGFFVIILGFKQLFYFKKHYHNIFGVYNKALFMIFCFAFLFVFSLKPINTMMESSIIVFLLIISVIMSVSFKDKLLTTLLPTIMYTVIIATLFGVYDFAASIIGLPRVFPSRAPGEILSGFRNAGQAGAYFLIMITILYPLRFSSLYNSLNTKNRKLLNISLLFSIVFLLLTGKIAAYIGMFFGFLFFAIQKRNFKTILGIVFFVIVLGIVFINLEKIAPEVHYRISMKFETRVENRIHNNIDPENDFLSDNIAAALSAFNERPLVGSGLGAFTGNFSDHEVHSTYFKMLGETGLIGTFGYLVFISSFLLTFRIRKYRKINYYADYLSAMFPFVLGCLISWAYTFHLRKREFWILVVVIAISTYQFHKTYNKNETENI